MRELVIKYDQKTN